MPSDEPRQSLLPVSYTHLDVYKRQVSARAGTELAVFEVAAHTTGISLSPCLTVDEQRAADISFNQVKLGPDARLGGDVRAPLQQVLDLSLIHI